MKSLFSKLTIALLIVSLASISTRQSGAALKYISPNFSPIPGLLWNTFLGGMDFDEPNDIVVDANENSYAIGFSDSTWGTPLNPYSGGSDTLIVKVDRNGVRKWHTFLGSPDWDYGTSIALDHNGNVFVVGISKAAWGTPINAFAGFDDAFVAKFNFNGVLQWNTFLGGSGEDWGYDIALDAAGNIYLTGYSKGTWGTPLNAHAGGGNDAFVAKLNNDGVFQWNTFLGGSDQVDHGFSISVSKSGNIFVTGESDNTWGTPINDHFGCCQSDAFIAKLTADGSLDWNTFLGGYSGDRGTRISVDSEDNAYITGFSWFANWGSPINPPGGGIQDAFVAKVTSNGEFQWNTFLGGTKDDVGYNITTDSSDNIYVTGYSATTWGRPVNPFAGYEDAFITKLNENGNILWTSFLGGWGADCGQGIAIYNGKIYLAGYSNRTWGNPIDGIVGTVDLFIAQVFFDSPFISSSVRVHPSPTSSPTVDFVVTFSERVSGVDKTDFTLTKTGSIRGYSIKSVSPANGSADTYTVSVATGKFNGSLRLDLVDDDSILNGDNKPLGGPGRENGSFTAGEAYIVKKYYSSNLNSIAPQDGWLLESGQTTNLGGTINTSAAAVNLGDNAQKKQYRSILSFNTKGLPDNAVITKVLLKVRKQGIAGGGNPVNTFQGFLVDVKKGFFSSTLGLQASDFQAGADTSLGPFKPDLKNGWYTFNLTPAKGYINKLNANGGMTQVRLRFKLDDNNNALANYLSLYSGNAPVSSRPQLIIEFHVP